MEAEQQWRQIYDPEVVERLRWDRQYWLVRIGGSEFAFSSFDGYVAALKDVWAAGLIPDHAPGPVRGIDLPAAAPRLSAIDDELTPLLAHGPEPET